MRRVAREDVFKLVFEFTFYDVPNEGTLELMLLDESLDDSDKDYLKSVYSGIVARYDELKETISSHLSGYKLERVYRPDFAVLLVATYELLEKTAPVAVIINEAVNLAKKFGTEKSGSFINGVLAKIAVEIK